MMGMPRTAPDTPRNWSSTCVKVMARKHAKKTMKVLLMFLSHFRCHVFSVIFTKMKLSRIIFVG